MIKVCLLIRVSTEKQNTDRQLLELTDFCKARHFKIVRTISSKVSGTRTGSDREVLVTEISRLGRKAKDIRHTIDRLHEKKVSIVFKNFGGIESLDENGNETFVTNIIISIYAELAQEERRILVERTKSGLAAARKKGKILGRPSGSKKTDPQLLKKYRKVSIFLNRGGSLSECMRVFDLSRNTVIKIKRLTMKK